MLPVATLTLHPLIGFLMRVLVIQNFAGTGLGQLRRALDEAGASIEIVRADDGDALPDAAGGHDALIVLGGGQNALADAAHPWFPQLLSLMRGFVDDKRSVLGVCLGGQLLARAYGAENIIGGASEFGWQTVELNEDGTADPLFSGVPGEFRIFQWHDDTFILPRGGLRLAGSRAVHNQAFRIGRAGYGIQFHFEADRALVEEWNGTFAEWLAERQPDWPERHPAEAARHGPQADAVGLAIARNWVATIER
jgi:GMP synthase-like glutamine amidotransferase